jgi:hypothetical protein
MWNGRHYISQNFGVGTVMISSGLMDRFERRGSHVRECVKAANCG